MKVRQLPFWIGILFSWAFAQDYSITHYTAREGLIQSQVRSILQDSQGYIWFGTHRGLSRFDGRNFTNYEPTDGVSGTFAGNFISEIYEHKDGNIWFATDRGVSYFDGQSFTNFVNEDSLAKVITILGDSYGRLWFGTEFRGLTLYENGKFSHKPFSWDYQANKRTVYDMIEDHAGNIWLGKDGGLFRYQPGTDTIFWVRSPALPEDIEVRCLLEDRYHDLWLGTNLGVFRYDGSEFMQFTKEDGLPDNAVYTILEDEQGQIWLGTGAGIVYYDRDQFFPITSTVNDQPLSYKIPSSMIDMEGNLWFGTEGGGVFKITKGIFTTYNQDRGLSSNLTKSFIEDRNGDIWISTVDKGVNRFDGKSFTHYGEKDGMGGNDIAFSFKDSKGHFWFATYNNGVTRYDGNRFEVFRKEDGLSNNKTFCVSEDSKGDIWIGTQFGISILKGNEFTILSKEDGMIDNPVYYIREHSNGDTWIGTPSGVSIYRNGTFINHDTLGNNILTILEGPKGRMWMNSSNGLLVYEDNRFTRILVDESPSANNVVSLVFEGEQYLWIGTEAGVYRLNLLAFYKDKSLLFDHYTYTDGLPSLETNANAMFRDSKGFVWIGTVEGAVKCRGRVRKENILFRPFVHITRVSTSKSDNWQELGFEVDKRSGLPTDLKIPFSKDNRVSFEFIGISLKNPNGVRYQYQLSPLDETWSESSQATNASFANLSPGEYAFRVRARTENGTWTENPAILEFEITPAFHQTWLFRFLVLAFLVLIGYAIYKVLAEQARRKREEERMTYKAEKLALESQALYAMMNPHFTFNALQSIQYYIHKQDRIAANKFLSRFAKLVRKNLESTKKEFISLGEEVERLDLYLSLEKMRFQEKLDYEIKVAKGIDQTETQIPPMLLQPFIENSIKHGISSMESGGMISVNIELKDEDFLLITIRDNGIGIEASKLKKVNRPKEHVSRGMQITRDRLALFGKMTGKGHAIDIEEIKNPDGTVAGTEVRILVPLT